MQTLLAAKRRSWFISIWLTSAQSRPVTSHARIPAETPFALAGIRQSTLATRFSLISSRKRRRVRVSNPANSPWATTPQLASTSRHSGWTSRRGVDLGRNLSGPVADYTARNSAGPTGQRAHQPTRLHDSSKKQRVDNPKRIVPRDTTLR
jgi:hypothetical protein